MQNLPREEEMIEIRKFIRPLKLTFAAAILSVLLATNASAAAQAKFVTGEFSPAKNSKLVTLAAVDLPQILPYIMGAGDVFQGYDIVIYKNVQAMRLRIFNQQTGRVRYVFVDLQTGRIL